MKLKRLEALLGELQSFINPKIALEQYSTSPNIAATIVHMINERENIENKYIADLGTGPGIFSIASSLLGAGYVLGIDIDDEALQIAQKNIDILEDNLGLIDLLQANVLDIGRQLKMNFDIIIMNPPFGTKCNKSIDISFLQVACSLSQNTIYSLHKSSTREYILRKAKAWNVNTEILAQLKYDIPAMYKCHKSSSKAIEVDLFCFSHRKRK